MHKSAIDTVRIIAAFEVSSVPLSLTMVLGLPYSTGTGEQ